MSVNPFPFTQAREVAATSPLDLGSGSARPVGSARSGKRIGEDDDGRGQGETSGQGRPREERERDTQRQALARLILGAFDVIVDTPSSAASAPPAPVPKPATAMASPVRDPELERAILEFMYALFHALDQIDDTEPLIEIVSRQVGFGPGATRTGRNAFGERLELLARHVAAIPPDGAPVPDDAVPGLEGVAPRLARSYTEVLRLLYAAGRADRPSSAATPRAQLAALLIRLANAMHVAPTLGYGMPSAAGAMLRVRA
jgi:hypothetical protein